MCFVSKQPGGAKVPPGFSYKKVDFNGFFWNDVV